MNVVIVGKTRMMKPHLCIGGLDLEENRGLRLLQFNGLNQLADTPFKVGDIWDIDYIPKQSVKPPHVEDVLVQRCKFMRTQIGMQQFLRERIHIWKGSPDNLFDGLLCATEAGSGYACIKAGIPNCSVGFWLPDKDLQVTNEFGKVRYKYPTPNKIKSLAYVGVAPPKDRLPEGFLLRVSLARWWSPSDMPQSEKRCYLQLSGWYASNEQYTMFS